MEYYHVTPTCSIYFFMLDVRTAYMVVQAGWRV